MPFIGIKEAPVSVLPLPRAQDKSQPLPKEEKWDTLPSSSPAPYLVCEAIGQGQIFLRICCKNVCCGVGPCDGEDAIRVEDESICGGSDRQQSWKREGAARLATEKLSRE